MKATNWTPFTQEQLDVVMRDIITRAQELMGSKGGEYAKGNDRLDNFRRNAASLSTDPELVWAVYAAKHWDAITTYITDITAGKTRERSEPIEGRAHDLINYLILFCALVQAREGQGSLDLGGKVKEELAIPAVPVPNYTRVSPHTHVYITDAGVYYNPALGSYVPELLAKFSNSDVFKSYADFEDMTMRHKV